MIIISINLRVVFNFEIFLFTYVIPLSTQTNLWWFKSNFLKSRFNLLFEKSQSGSQKYFPQNIFELVGQKVSVATTKLRYFSVQTATEDT